MPQLVVTGRDGVARRVEATAGRSAMEAMLYAGTQGLFAFCGGWGVCATCHVYVAPGFSAVLEPPGEMELAMLDHSPHRTGTSRLACQITISETLDGLSLTVAPED